MPDESRYRSKKIPIEEATGDLDLDWSDLKRFAGSRQLTGGKSRASNLDTLEGQARVLREIIEAKEEKTENRLNAVKQLRELRGTDRVKTENLSLMTNRELIEIFNQEIFPILALFQVKS